MSVPRTAYLRARHVLGDVRRAAAGAVYRDAPRFRLRLQGTVTEFSTEEPAGYRWFYPRYAFNRVHEKPVTLRMLEDLRSARCFVDVGANLGFYTCVARRFLPTGAEVHAFEMDVDNYAMLEKNVGLNPSGHAVTTNHAAVSDRDHPLTYRRPPRGNHPALSLYEATPEEGALDVTVPAVRLDDYFGDRAVRPDVVKIDVEGAELDVLRGMTSLLPDVQRMYVEVHPENLAVAGQSADEVMQLLGEQFELYLLPGHRGQRRHGWERITPSTPLPGNTIVCAVRA